MCTGKIRASLQILILLQSVVRRLHTTILEKHAGIPPEFFCEILVNIDAFALASELDNVPDCVS